MELKGAKDCWLIFRNNLLKAQEHSILMCSQLSRRPAKVKGYLLAKLTRQTRMIQGKSNLSCS